MRVYKYGLRAPTQGANLAADQLHGAHRYRNQLIKIERARRDALREVLADYDDTALIAAVQAAQEALDAAQDVIRMKRKEARSRAETADDRMRVRELRTALKEARAALKEQRARARRDPDLAAAREAINDRFREQRRIARKASGLRWGTYQLIEDAVGQMAKAPLWRSEGKPSDPCFLRWTGKGQISEQLIKGCSVADIHSGRHTQVQIDPVPAEAWTGTRGQRRRLTRTTLRLRVGSDEKRQPIWAEWPMVLHRPLPEGCRIKRVAVSRHPTGRTAGRRYEWSCEITVDETPPKPSTAPRTVAIDLGWRLTDDRGLRVATTSDDERHEDMLVLNPSVASSFNRAARVRGVRDRRLNLMRPQLATWLRERDLPEWLAERTQHIGQWRSLGRFRRLAMEWRANRWEGDTEGYELLEAWRYRDEHLREYERGTRSKALRRRREQYRIWVARLCERASIVVIEQFDLRKMARLPQVDDDAQNPHARSQRVQAATSELRDSLLSAASARGVTVVEVSAVNSTRECHACRSIETWDAAAYVTHACQKCSEIWDQDINAARVLLERYTSDPGGAKILTTARTKKDKEVESRWARAKRLAKEKRDGARKPTAKHTESKGA